MANRSSENLINHLNKKKQFSSIRVTTRLDGCKLTAYINGRNKNKFIEDCIRLEFKESRMLRYIIDTYYSTISLDPELTSMQPNEIKNWIKDRIKI